MLPDMDVMSCRNLAVPMGVMQHVVSVESSFNRYAIGVVGGRLVRQPASLPEAIATARMLQDRGFNFSLGLAQVNRDNLARYGLSFERAFQVCPNLRAGARILADCLVRSNNDWGKSLSCYYSGNFVTGFRQGYVRKVFASMRAGTPAGVLNVAGAIAVIAAGKGKRPDAPRMATSTLIALRSENGATQATSMVVADPTPRAAVIADPMVPASTRQKPASEAAPSHVDPAFVF